ncbi:purine nucleoside permease-domain-containing protein [Apodospora peruviana]|uniref:Purine nucleoside permease-domain-containing protein n=1 Tax=Apodospora peruviana TaxID=516989 RepID=A0AAE0LZB2_9PEZI|nr:purine nucleoside permease-domain-containing protein [Apodospora peruviana]
MPGSGLGDLLAVNISTPGLSMMYPNVHCTANFTVCQVTTGESEINAAVTITALALSPKLDLRLTYFLLAGIAGVNPKYATLGGVALARFSVQVALQYEFDVREMPDNFSTGYFSYGTSQPNQYPTTLYGTEVFEVNEALRDLAYTFALRANLSDNEDCDSYRERYVPASDVYGAAAGAPLVVKCDTATSDVYWSGNLLSEAFENVTRLWTNGTGRYCMTAQEDSAILEALTRASIGGLADYSRIIVMRTGSNFDRPPPDMSSYDNLLVVQQNGYRIAIENIFLAGIEIVKGIIGNWDCAFRRGIHTSNYVGDIFGSLGGQPDFGPGSLTGGIGVKGDSLANSDTTKRDGGNCPPQAPLIRRHKVAYPVVRHRV